MLKIPKLLVQHAVVVLEEKSGGGGAELTEYFRGIRISVEYRCLQKKSLQRSETQEKMWFSY